MDRARAHRLEKELAGREVGSWTIEKLINNGGSAAVFVGRKNDIEAAVKIFDPELIERYGERVQRERLRRELELIGQQHPNLVEILEGGTCTSSGYDFVVMKLYPWKTLKECVKDFPRERIEGAIAQLASAAHYLHKKGLVHRDIKPSNIVVSPDFSIVVLLDLGVVRPIGGSDITESAEFLGTRRYSPPEFIFRKETDDQRGWLAITFYQLGAVLHDMIMRTPLFDGIENIAALIDAIRSDAPKVNATDVSLGLKQLSRACLTKGSELRLRLVEWPSFEAADSYRVPTLIMRGQGHAQQGDDKQLAVITAMIRERVRARCVGSGDFPPLTITSGCGDSIAQIRLRFAPSSRHRLRCALWLIFRVIVLDASLQLVRIAVTFAVSPSGMSADSVDSPYAIIDTNIDSDAIDALVQRLLGLAFELAQAIEVPVHEITPLGIEEGTSS